MIDLLFLMPENVIDRRYRPTIADLQPGRVATLDVTIARIAPPAHKRQPWTVSVTDGTGVLDIAFFSRWMARRAVQDAAMKISGRTEIFNRRSVMNTPDYFVPAPYTHLTLPTIYSG